MNIDLGISEWVWHRIILTLTFWIITTFLTITVSYYPSTNLFVQTDVNTAITTTVVLYAVYLKSLPHMLLTNEGKFTLEQVMMTYTDSREMLLIFLTSLLIGAECPMPHTGQRHNVFTILPYKTWQYKRYHLQRTSTEYRRNVYFKLRKQCLLYIDIEKCTKLRTGPNKIAVQSSTIIY